MMARPLWCTLTAFALLVAPSLGKNRPLLIWNASSSVPTGLYWVRQIRPRVGDLAVVRLPAHVAALATDRGYLPSTVYLLKPVVAANGDRVCRYGGHLFVRGAFTARALEMDSRRRPLPVWQGCRTLRTGDFFLLAHEPQSFDSRYFGLIRADRVIGRATLIFRPPPDAASAR
jgi:conjugative transfer signal peptidase TraF